MCRQNLAILFISLFLASCNHSQVADAGKSEDVKPDYAEQLGFQPNILWISCEDIGPVFPMYGDSTIEMPNLSRLADEGIVFDQAFSVSGVCSPSRSALITGMYPASIGTHNHRSQIHMREEIPAYEAVPPEYVKCFTEYFRKAGYYCTNNGKTDYNFGGGINKAPVSAFDKNGYGTDWSGRKPGQPFFTIMNHNVTHMFQLWKRRDQPLRVDPNKVPVPPYFPDTYKARISIARLYDNAMVLDEQIGEILDKLERENLMDSTIIFFFSDHGDALPRNKIWVYDSGIRVPFIVRFPDKLKAGTRSDDLVSFVDFAPTVLTLAGLNVPKHLQGQSFLPEPTNKRDYIYAAKDRIDYEVDQIRAVRDKKYKYIKNYMSERPYIQNFPWSDNIYLTQEWKRLYAKDSLNEYQMQFFRKTRPEEELFDIENDPHELNNLASDPKYADVLSQMRRMNERHVSTTGDMGFVNENQLIEMFWPGNRQPVTQSPEISFNNGNAHISCPTPGASIVYQRGNSSKNEWNLYNGPFEVSAGEQISAKAIRYGFKESQVSELMK